MEAILFNGMSKSEFLNCLREVVREELVLLNNPNTSQTEFLSIGELQKLFNPRVSRPTIDNWCRRGILNKI